MAADPRAGLASQSLPGLTRQSILRCSQRPITLRTVGALVSELKLEIRRRRDCAAAWIAGPSPAMTRGGSRARQIAGALLAALGLLHCLPARAQKARLHRPEDRARDRDARGRRLRPLRAAGRALSRKLSAGQSDLRAAEHAGRGLADRRQLALQRRTQGRHRDRHHPKRDAVRESARQCERALRCARVQLAREPQRLHRRRGGLARRAGADRGGPVHARTPRRQQRAGLRHHGVAAAAECADRDQIQDR